MISCFNRVLLVAFAAYGIVVLVGCPSSPSGQGWSYSTEEWARGESVALTLNGGFFVVGRAGSGGDPQVFCALISTNGQLGMSRTFRELYLPSVEPTNSIGIVSNSGQFIFAGLDGAIYTSDSISRGRLRIVQTDSALNTVADHTYGEDVQWRVGSLLTAENGAVILAGTKHVKDPPVATFILRSYPNGVVSVLGVYGDNQSDNSSVLFPVRDCTFAMNGDIIVAGDRISPDSNRYGIDMGLIRARRDGALVWLKGFEKPGTQEAYALSALPDGSFLLAGKSGDPEIPYLIKADANGDELWACGGGEILGFDPADYHYEIWDMTVDTDGSIVLVGEALQVRYPGGLPIFPVQDRASIVIKLNADGTHIWTRSLLARLYGVCLTNRGTYMTVGSYGDRLNLIEVDRNGNVVN